MQSRTARRPPTRGQGSAGDAALDELFWNAHARNSSRTTSLAQLSVMSDATLYWRTLTRSTAGLDIREKHYVGDTLNFAERERGLEPATSSLGSGVSAQTRTQYSW